MAPLKESFGIYFRGIKYIYFLKEMDCVYIYYKYMACWASGSIFKKLFRDGG